jgi:uncharacterized protein involved in response to NO
MMARTVMVSRSFREMAAFIGRAYGLESCISLFWRKDGRRAGEHLALQISKELTMSHLGPSTRAIHHKPVPRGLATSGPPILSYGFRPFFLGAGLYAVTAMIVWIGALSGLWPVGGVEGPVAWHAHEMLFGYAAAALGGFVLTAVPNWTGSLPVSGKPLLVLVGLWLAGRGVSMAPGLLGDMASAVIDMLFLPALAFVVAREVVAGRNWQNLRVAVAISSLGALNIAFHLLVLAGGDPAIAMRATVALYVLLVCQIGGRIIPSFTRNYLARQRATRLPAPMGRFDPIVLAATLLAGIAWAILPDSWLTAALGLVVAGLNGARLYRWRGLASWREPLVFVLHVAYAFVPIGYGSVTLVALGLLPAPLAVHLLTVGVISMMTLAVMSRATRGHTGRPLAASRLTTLTYACLLAVALLRPVAEIAPDWYLPILTLSALAWIVAYGLFVIEHAPMLLRPSPPKANRPYTSKSPVT